jgi:sugar-specific transcriptional regulator TrmB
MSITNLEHFGLSKNEAAVYAASLELGPATADQLAKHSGVKRSTTYLQIESLQEMGLMSTYEDGKKTLFTPESPENISRLIDRQKAALDLRYEELNQQLPELIRSFESAGERPVVRFYQGKEGITSLREESLKASMKEIYVISSNDHLSEVFSRDERDAFSQKRANAGIITNLLYTRKNGKFTDAPNPNTVRAYISPDAFNLGTDIIVFDDYVGMIALRGNIFGVLIKSEEIAKSMKTIFARLWSTAEIH